MFRKSALPWLIRSASLVARLAGVLILVILFEACHVREQQVERLGVDVSRDTSWQVSALVGPLIYETQYCVLIDGYLDAPAALETRWDIIGTPVPEGYKKVLSGFSQLPKGKFSLGFNVDYSGGAHTFVYHPFQARQGHVTIRIVPGTLPSDSSRTYPNAYPGRGGLLGPYKL